ncbi:MAG: GntR family transcriptional regulator [Chloroflexota bacterium]
MMVNDDSNAVPMNEKLQLVNIRDEVYKLLHTRILNHEYPPGYRFDLSRLETQLGISRTPLKEALHRLEAEGLIEIRPRRGTYVISLDAEEVAESFDVRRMLECAAAEVAVRNASDQQIQALRTHISQMSQLLVSDEYQVVISEYIELDRQFHRSLIDLAGNKRLTQIWKQLDTHVQIARVRQKFILSDSKKNTEAEHEMILQALEQRDAPALNQALAEHINLSKERTLKIIEGYG